MIAFGSDRAAPGSSYIYTMRDDGSEVRQITSGSASDYWPSWSPDGREIAFLRDTTGLDNDVYVVHADGSGLRRLTSTPSRLEFGLGWSPDGRGIVFGGCADGLRCHLYTMRPDGTHEHQITFANFDQPAPIPYADQFGHNAFDRAFWLSYGPNGSGNPGPTMTPANGRLEFSFPAATLADPDLGFAAVQMISRCQLVGDFDFQVDYRLLTWPAANGVIFALGAESPVNDGSMSVDRRSVSGEQYFAQERPAGGSFTGGSVPTGDQHGTLRLVRSGTTGTAYALSGGNWLPIVTGPAPTDALQITLTAFTADSFFGHQEVRAAFDNFQLASGTFDPSSCIGLRDFAPDWTATGA